MSIPWTVWRDAARPKTLPAGCAPVFMGMAMAASSGRFHGPSALAALLGAILIQIGTNYANDFFDFVKGTDTEERIGPVRATQAGLVPPRTMLFATVLVFALVFLPGAYLVYRGGWSILIIGLVSILCGVLYTGGPFPLGYLGLGDLFVLIFFGPIAVGGTFYVQAQEWGAASLFAGLAPGLISTAILTVNNLRDIEGDRKSGKKTLAVRFGRTFARVEYAACMLLATLAVPIVLSTELFRSAGVMGIYLGGAIFGAFAIYDKPDCHVLLACAAALPALLHTRTAWRSTDGEVLNGLLAKTGKLLLLFTLLFCIGWLL